MARKINIGGHRIGTAQLVSAVVAILGVVVVVGTVLVLQRRSSIAEAEAWTPVAAACPVLSKAEFLATGEKADHVSNYDEIRFGRGYGYVTCNEIASEGGRGSGIVPVCQFNNPTVLQVITKRGEFFFATHSHGATVLVEDGQPRCVLAANQKPQ